MSETIKHSTLVHRSDPYLEDNGRQSHDHKTDRIPSATASSIYYGDLPGSETLRLYRKVYR
tara:strand:+ start:678 stop:860 length:183 start_codon:yes stop_codon:yes gene_type:complete